MSEPSIFTKIVTGELPSHKVYEDESTLAFLNITPSHPGHTLVIPKKQVDQYIDLDDETYEQLWRTVKKVASRLRDVMGTERVGVVISGVDVPHAHVHLIPFDKGQLLKTDQKNPVADSSQLAEIAAKLHFE